MDPSSNPGQLACLANEHVLAMSPYVPGRQMNDPDWIKLNTNELPYPPSPRVEAAIRGEMDRLVKYPDPTSESLRNRIADHHGLKPSQVIAGNGSDDVLNLLCRVFASGGRRVGRVVPSYSLYPVLAAAQGAAMVEVPVDEGFNFDPARVVASGANLFFLTSPNAPSGVGYPAAMIGELAGDFPGILVVDEAYANFASENAVGLLNDHPNLVVTRTFSKAFGLAGLRVGYGLGSPVVIELLNRVRDAYNLDRFAQAGARAALEDYGYFEALIGKIQRVRDFYRKEFLKLGWEVPASQANFLLVQPVDGQGRSGPEVAASLMQELERERILVRYFPSHPLTQSSLRISIGSEAQMYRLMEVIEGWMKH